jgi:hypothetical protein
MMDKDSPEPEFLGAVESSRRKTFRQQNDGPSSPRPPQRDVVDLTSDLDLDSDSDIEEVFPKSKSVVSSETEDVDEHEQLQRAIAMSLEPSDNPSSTTIAPRETPVAPGGILSSLNRKQMEQERLARAAKRKFEDPPSAQPSPKLFRPEPNPVRPIAPVRKPVRPFQTSTPQASASQARPPQPKAAQAVRRSEVCRRVESNALDADVRPTSRSVLQWPLGAVKKTHIAGSPRTGNDITIEEVIQRDDLDLGVFSSFLWDLEWLFTKINTQVSRIMLIMQANDETTVSSTM